MLPERVFLPLPTSCHGCRFTVACAGFGRSAPGVPPPASGRGACLAVIQAAVAQGPRVAGVTSPFPMDFPMTPDCPLYPTPRQIDQQENGNTGAGPHLALDWERESWWERPWLGVPRPSCGLQTKGGPGLGAWEPWNQMDSGPNSWFPLP